MELANIEKLLQKYEDGTTTLNEEGVLKTYFLSEKVAPQFEAYIPIFLYFNDNKKQTFNKTIQLKPKKINWKWLTSVASVALLFSFFVGYNQYHEYQQKQVLSQVQDAMLLLSKNLQKGDQAVANLYTYENSVHKIFKTK